MNNQIAHVVVGLGFGDEGKGTIVDFLTREFHSDLTVRFSGGSQCGHGVMTNQGEYHVFSQFGSGTLAGARTLLTNNVFVNLFNLENEFKKLRHLLPNNPFEKLYINENTPIITPYHVAVCRLLEINRGMGKHGSCGQGVWQTRLDYMHYPREAILIKDLKNQHNLRVKMNAVKKRMIDILDKECNSFNPISHPEYLNIFINKDFARNLYDLINVLGINIVSDDEMMSMINESNNPVFEGNQGIGLDDIYGFFPYVTATDTTSKKALELLNCACFHGETNVVGVTRPYITRHGAGPFVTEDKILSNTLKDRHNQTNKWQDNFKYGWFDLELLDYTLQVDKNIDSIAFTHLDDLEKLYVWNVCSGYLNKEGKKYCLIEDVFFNGIPSEEITTKILTSTPIYDKVLKENVTEFIEDYFDRTYIKSYGPRYMDKILIK